MSYELAFFDSALKEWRQLDRQIQIQLKAKLAERLEHPHIPSARLHGAANRYKIKLRAAGYRLVYEVRDRELLVLVIAVGRRDKDTVYRLAAGRSGDAE